VIKKCVTKQITVVEKKKRGCKGCYYDFNCKELLNKYFIFYTLSPSDLRKIGDIIKKIIISKYYCKIDCILFRNEEIVLEVSVSGLCLNISFNIKCLLELELNKDYILNCVDYAILNYYRKD